MTLAVVLQPLQPHPTAKDLDDLVPLGGAEIDQTDDRKTEAVPPFGELAAANEHGNGAGCRVQVSKVETALYDGTLAELCQHGAVRSLQVGMVLGIVEKLVAVADVDDPPVFAV